MQLAGFNTTDLGAYIDKIVEQLVVNSTAQQQQKVILIRILANPNQFKILGRRRRSRRSPGRPGRSCSHGSDPKSS